MTARETTAVMEGAPAAGEASPAPARGSWYTVITLSLVMMLAYIDRGVISLFVQPMKRDLTLSDTQISLLLGVAFTLPYIVIGLPMSRIVDRGTRKFLISGSLAVWSFTTSLCGIAQSYGALFAARAVVGSSESVVTPATISLIADAVPRERLPRAYAIYNGGILSGSAMALLIGGALMGLLAGVPPIGLPGIGVLRNWQLVFMMVGLPGLLVAVLVLATVPEPLRRGACRPQGYPLREVLASVFRQRALHLNLLSAMVLLGMMNSAMAAWMPAFYERTYGWGPATAGPLLGATSLVTAVLGLVSGAWLAERLGRRNSDANVRVLFLAQLFSFPLVLAALLMPSPWLALGCSAIGGAFAGMGGPGFVSALQIATPNEMRGQINVFYATLVNVIGGSVGPTLAGFLTDTFASSEADLRYVLVTIKLAVGPLALVLIWRAMAPYARIHSKGPAD